MWACGCGVEQSGARLDATLGVMSSNSSSSPSITSWANVQLVIMRHSVHKVIGDEGPTHDREYVVTNMRPFTVDVQLIDLSGERAQECFYNLPVTVSLCYENGKPVRAASGTGVSISEPLLLGDVKTMLVQGRGTLKIQMGKDALTSKLGRQRMRIKIEPSEESLRQYPMLTVLSEALRSVTKLERRTAAAPEPENRQSLPPLWSSSNDSLPLVDASPLTSPRSHLDRPGNMLGSDPAGSSAMSMYTPEPISRCSSVSDYGSMAAISDASTVHHDVTVPHKDREVALLKQQLSQVRDGYQKAISKLHRQLSDEHSQNMNIKQILAYQQQQMQQLAQQNEAILKEVAELRKQQIDMF